MPQFSDKQVFSDLFIPPEGYKTDFIEMTTFTLSSRLLIQIPLLIECGENRTKLPTQLNRAIKKDSYKNYSKCFHIYYDGVMKATVDDISFVNSIRGKIADLLKLSNCTPVIREKGLFHPKIMIFQFSKSSGESNEKKEYFFRIHISSRNLAMSDFLEAGVTLEGTPAQDLVKGNKNNENNENNGIVCLKSLFEELSKIKKDSECKKADEKKIDWEILLKSQFQLITNSEEKVNTFKIYISGMELKNESQSLCELINNDILESYGIRVTSMNPSFGIFGTKHAEYICNFKDIYEKKQNDESIWERKISSTEAAYICSKDNKIKVNPRKPRNLHIKQYIISKSNDEKIVWIGSANCSKNALCGTNAEIMVRYSVKASAICPDKSTSQSNFIGGYGYYSGEPVENPQISDVDDEESFLNICIKKLCIGGTDKNKGIEIKIELEIKETNELEIRLGKNIGKMETKEGKKVTISFKNIEPKNWSNMLLVRKKDNPERWFGMDLTPYLPEDIKKALLSDDAWKEMVDKLPLQPIESVKELVPELRDYKNPADEAYERLMKGYFFSNDRLDDFLKEIKENIDKRIAEEKCFNIDFKNNSLGKDDEDEEEFRMRLESVQSTRQLKEDIKLLSDMIKQLQNKIPKKV